MFLCLSSFIGTQDSYATVEGIIAREGIPSVKALKGKKLAVTFASSAHVLVLDVFKNEAGNAPTPPGLLLKAISRAYPS